MSRTVVLWLAIAGILIQPLDLGSNRIPAMASDGTPGLLVICAVHGVSHIEFESSRDASGKPTGSAKTCGVCLFCNTIEPTVATVGILLGPFPPTTSAHLIQPADSERASTNQSAYSERAPPALV